MSAISIRDLALEFGGTEPVRALDGVDLAIGSGSATAIVGESGSGKSTLAAVVARLQPRSSRILRGSVEVGGMDVLALGDRDLRAFRRDSLGWVSQDPIGSLDPTMRIGRQLALVLRERGEDDSPARRVAILEEMRIDDAPRVLRLFPHQTSGGMAQRIAIALAMIGSPRVLIADEPTAALDSQVRGEVTRLLFERVRAAGTTLVWLSHDLPAVARWCDDIAVMYAGRVVERGPAADVLRDPVHPYTRALAATDPARTPRGERLEGIPGTPPVLHGAAEGCAFAPRCALRVDACTTTRPEPAAVRESLCIRTEELVGVGGRDE